MTGLETRHGTVRGDCPLPRNLQEKDQGLTALARATQGKKPVFKDKEIQ